MHFRKCGDHYPSLLPICRLSRWSPSLSRMRSRCVNLRPQWEREGLLPLSWADCWQVDLLIPAPLPARPPPGSASCPPARHALVPPAVSPRVLGRGRRKLRFLCRGLLAPGATVAFQLPRCPAPRAPPAPPWAAWTPTQGTLALLVSEGERGACGGGGCGPVSGPLTACAPEWAKGARWTPEICVPRRWPG